MVSTPALAADSLSADSERTGNNDIIVTARRVEERLQDVPIAITAFSQQQLDHHNITNIKDLATITPSLSTNARFGSENMTFSIRGFFQDLFTAPSVAIYFAEATAPRGASSVQGGDGAGPGAFFDLENVQVLKGPQGTLFGRNTTGGAILLVPRKPRNEFGGYVEASYGNYDMTRVQAVLNIPVGEGGLRLGFERGTRDGFLKNVGVGPARLADTNYVAGRAGLLLKLGPDFENYTIATYAESDTTGPTAKPIACNPAVVLGSTTVSPPRGAVPSGRMFCDALDRVNATGDYYAVANPVLNPRSYMEQWQVINTTTWRVSDQITLKNIVTYGEIRNLLNQDPLGTFWQIRADDPAAGNAGLISQSTGTVILQSEARGAPLNNAQSTFTEEFQIQGRAADSRLTYTLGAYYEISKTIPDFVGNRGTNYNVCPDIANLVCRAPYGLTGSVTEELRNTTYKGWALFAQATWAITERLRLTGGIRYTVDMSKSVDIQKTYRFLPNGTLSATTCTNANAALPNCIVVTPGDGSYFRTSAPTWLVSLDYKPADNILLYAKVAKGYRQGAVNPRSLIPYKTFGPEKLYSYEVGAKFQWDGAIPGVLNLAAFYNDFKTQQFLNTWSEANGSRTTTGISNTASSRNYGFEAEGHIEPARGLRISAAISYLDSKLTAVATPPGPPGFPNLIQTSLAQQPLPFSPKVKLTAGVSYRLPLDTSLGEVRWGANVQHSSSYYATNRLNAFIDSYTTLNMTLDWKDIGGQPIDLSFFVNNLTETKYLVFKTDVLASLGGITALTGEPRMFGIRARVRFGSDAK